MEKKYEAPIHYLMSFIGGFFGVYSILNFCDFFGNAQTANMIYLITNLLGHNFSSALIRLGGVAVYMLPTSPNIPASASRLQVYFWTVRLPLWLVSFLPGWIRYWPSIRFSSPPHSSGEALKALMDSQALPFFPLTTFGSLLLL